MYKKQEREKHWVLGAIKIEAAGQKLVLLYKKILYVIKYKHIIGYNNAA